MFNYLKWELKDYILGKYKWFITIFVTLLLFVILPYEKDGLITGLLALMVSIITLVSMFSAYFAGAKYTVDTFNKKTFLLESMIPISAKKLLVGKYLLGIIINAIYILILIAIILAFTIKGIGIEDTFEVLKQVVKLADIEDVVNYIILLICTSMAFFSIVILAFVGAKVINPNGKHDKILGFILAVILLYTVAYVITTTSTINESFIAADITYIVISVIAFYITAHLIENKLEIYN